MLKRFSQFVLQHKILNYMTELVVMDIKLKYFITEHDDSSIH